MGATGKIVPMGGTATTTETEVVFPAAYKRGYPNSNQTQPTPPKRSTFLRNLRIQNLDATNNLLVRLNGSAQQITVKPNVPHEMDIGVVHRMTVQSSAATVAWDVTAVGSA